MPKIVFIPDRVLLNLGLARGKTENNKHTKQTLLRFMKHIHQP